LIIALVVLSALLHATWNALLRVEKDRDRALVAAVSTATLIAFVVASVRWALGEPPFATVASAAWTVAAGVLECAYFVSLAKAFDRGRLGAVYTITRGGAILIVWPLSIGLFSERVTLLSVIGSAIVLGGLGLSSLGTGDAKTSRSGALAWATACAIAIAGYHLAYKGALREGGSPSAVFACALGVATLINVARLGAVGRAAVVSIVRTRPSRVAVMGLVCGGSFLILMEALAAGGAGFVLTLRNTSVLFAVALAYLIRERPRRVEIIGAILVAAGAILMAWPA
jgi:drug/metabolite transporter (DMT)-like permease